MSSIVAHQNLMDENIILNQFNPAYTNPSNIHIYDEIPAYDSIPAVIPSSDDGSYVSHVIDDEILEASDNNDESYVNCQESTRSGEEIPGRAFSDHEVDQENAVGIPIFKSNADCDEDSESYVSQGVANDQDAQGEDSDDYIWNNYFVEDWWILIKCTCTCYIVCVVSWFVYVLTSVWIETV